MPTKTQTFIDLETQHGAHNYHPLPVVLTRGKGIDVWDVEGRRYFDFLSAYSACNQGHCHPQILAAMIEQAEKLTLTSRAFHNDRLGPCEKLLTELFGYDKVLMMNSGAEAVETAIKLCRKWAYQKKKIKDGCAKIVVCEGNFHGRTVTIISASTSSDSRDGFGPYTPGFIKIPYGDSAALEKALEDPDVAGFLFEPIQGEAGVIVPPSGWIKECALLCKQYNVLFIADEIQTGLGRTGKMLCCDHENVRPDLVILGKALSGGMMPVSAVLADDDVMLCIRPGEHGSTFGGNPLACAVTEAAIGVLVDEKLPENALKLGDLFRAGLRQIASPLVSDIRGKGLLTGVMIGKQSGKSALDLCMKLMENGLLAKPTRDDTIRFAPPLIVSEAQIQEALAIIKASLIILQK